MNAQNGLDRPLVLIVEDDPDIRELLRTVLEADACQVVEVDDGEPALDLVARMKPDLIVLDARLPVLEGYETCRRLRALPGGEHTPVLMITAPRGRSAEERAFEAGADDFVPKPLHLAVFTQRVRRLLNRHRARTALTQSAESFESLFHATTEGIMIVADGRIVRVNDTYLRLSGYSIGEVIGRNPLDFAAPEAHAALRAHLQPFDGMPYEAPALLKDGSIMPVELTSRTIRYGGQSARLTTIRDITERKRSEAALAERANHEATIATLGQAALARSDERLLLHDACALIARTLDLRFCQVFLARPGSDRLLLRAATGWPAELVGQATIAAAEAFGDEPPVGLIATTPNAAVPPLLRDQGIDSWLHVIIPGRPEPFGVFGVGSATPRVFTAGETHFLQVVARILATAIERAAAEQEGRRQALYDTLTGLPNRVLFLARLQHTIERVRRHPHERFAVLCLDLDHFKTFNDSLGHTLGDQLLTVIAQRLETCVLLGDTVARLGGDEFAILLLEDVLDVAAAVAVAERIQLALAAPLQLEEQELVLSASIGIAFSADGEQSPEDVLRDADIAMYRAKSGGRARQELFDQAMHARIMARVRLEADLRRAVERQEFVLQYQPLIDLADGAIVGVEALVRWQHPTRGFVSPADFIPLAEETGLIVPLGEWTLRTACRQARAWRVDGLPPLTVSVNLSARQFRLPGLTAMIAQILQQTGLEPESLELELTESSAMEDAAATTATLQELRALGVQLALDDFGTGYSSLSYLKRFPLTTLKIDHSFIRDITSDPNDAAITKATIVMAHALGLTVLAEGVESVDQLAFLRAHGCDRAQGFFFSRPLSADAMAVELGQRARYPISAVAA